MQPLNVPRQVQLLTPPNKTTRSTKHMGIASFPPFPRVKREGLHT